MIDMKYRYAKILAILSILMTYGCSSTDITTQMHDRGVDVTEVFKPTDSRHNLDGRDYYFVHFAFNDALNEMQFPDDTILYEGEISVLSTFDCESKQQYNNAYIVIRNSDFVDRHYFENCLSEYDSFLGYVGPRNFNYAQKWYSTENKEINYFEGPYFEWEPYYLIPVKSNRLIVSGVESALAQKELTGLTPDSELRLSLMPSRMGLLFEDGDDVYKDFSPKLEYYNLKYDELRMID